MEKMRCYYDADRTETPAPTNYQTGQNQHELYCSSCGELLFVNELIFDDVNRVIEKTSENPFLCEACLDEYEEMAHRP